MSIERRIELIESFKRKQQKELEAYERQKKWKTEHQKENGK